MEGGCFSFWWWLRVFNEKVINACQKLTGRELIKTFGLLLWNSKEGFDVDSIGSNQALALNVWFMESCFLRMNQLRIKTFRRLVWYFGRFGIVDLA